jgi:hypothetical protein
MELAELREIYKERHTLYFPEALRDAYTKRFTIFDRNRDELVKFSELQVFQE